MLVKNEDTWSLGTTVSSKNYNYLAKTTALCWQLEILHQDLAQSYHWHLVLSCHFVYFIVNESDTFLQTIY